MQVRRRAWQTASRRRRHCRCCRKTACLFGFVDDAVVGILGGAGRIGHELRRRQRARAHNRREDRVLQDYRIGGDVEVGDVSTLVAALRAVLNTNWSPPMPPTRTSLPAPPVSMSFPAKAAQLSWKPPCRHNRPSPTKSAPPSSTSLPPPPRRFGGWSSTREAATTPRPPFHRL